MKVIFVGGCHLVGKPHGVQYGFVRLLWRRWRKLNRKLHFDMVPYAVNWEALLQACKDGLAGSPDVLILNIQAGLVLPTWERTLKRWRVTTGETAEVTLNWLAPTIWKPQGKGRIYWGIKGALIVLFGGHRENWHRIREIWEELTNLFAQSPSRIIVMTPTPVRKEYFVWGKSHLERVRKMVLEGHYYEVCDVYPELLSIGSEALWIDGQHISILGHVKVADALWRLLGRDEPIIEESV